MNNTQKMKTLWRFTRGSRGTFTIGLVSVILAAMANFAGPLVISITVDALVKEPNSSAPGFIQRWIDQAGGNEALINNLWLVAVIFIAIMATRSLFMFLKGRYIAVGSEVVAKKVRDKVYNHLQRLPYDYHVKAETGDLIQRCTTDVETIRRFMAIQLAETFRLITMVVIALLILIPINPRLTLFSLILMPFLIVLSFWFFSKVQKQFTKVEEADGKLSTVLQEGLTGVRVVRAFGRQKFEQDKFREANYDFRGKSLHLMKYFAAFYGGTDVIVMAQTMLAMVLGIIAAVQGEITVGQYLLYISYVGMMVWPFRQFGRVLADMGKAMIATGRLDEILTSPVETSGDHPVSPRLDQDIVFRNVDFAYDDDKVLKDLSVTINKGETVAILGATGSGKSTFVHLLQRLYDYQRGSITIGDVELNTIDKTHLRSRIGIVLQEPFLYSRTIKENIGITMSDDDDENLIYEAARTASVHDVIEDFELGYDTIVGERGVTLSGGQKQRVAIARTILRDSDILIFDDSLSAVDTETDAKIREALKMRRQGVTTFIISHRISTLMEADKILVMEDGHVVQQGTHEELVHQQGLYARIWEIQASFNEEGSDLIE